jgi:hypothetical protein
MHSDHAGRLQQGCTATDQPKVIFYYDLRSAFPHDLRKNDTTSAL